MQALAGYTGWKFEYVKCDWSNCFDKIENGHIAKPIQVDKLLSILSEVIRKTGFGKTWIYKLISAGKFPKQIKIGDRAVAFIESEVDEWIYKAITASRNTSN